MVFISLFLNSSAMNEYEFPDSKLANVQSQFDKLVQTNYYLNRAARDAYRSYLHVPLP